MHSTRFFSIPTNQGMKMVNIKNIASIEANGVSTLVTLNVNGKDGNPISFVANLEWGYLTGTIMAMDKELGTDNENS